MKFTRIRIGLTTTALVAATAMFAPLPALAGTLAPLSGSEKGDGSMSAVARQAMTRGALRLKADEALKAAANRAVRSAASSNAAGAAATGSRGPLVPVVQQNIAGPVDRGVTPPDTFAATGLKRVIQTVNRRVGIFNRAGGLIVNDSLNSLFGITANNFDPQILWDHSTKRFYYAGDTVVSSSDNRIAFGFSKSAQPNNATTDWCHYLLPYGARFPDYPKLGDDKLFAFVGVNNFQPGFVGSDVVAFRKPVGTAAITTCPSIGFNIYANLVDNLGSLVFTPVPGNFIDKKNNNAYSISRTLGLPSTRLIIHAFLGGSATTFPALQPPRVVTVASYTAPSDAVQPTFTQRLDTLDARPWQAILSLNPARGNAISMWTQHTIAGSSGAASDIRFYEIRPDVGAPIVQRVDTIGTGFDNTWFFNGAISSDRIPKDPTTGDDMVIGYNVSDSAINPRIVAGSSINGGALSFVLVQNGLGPYRDFACAGAGSTCRWGDYASAVPDPKPQGGAAHAVGLTHQWSIGGPMPTTQSNWETRIYHIVP